MHDELELRLGCVKVQDAEGYQFLLGADVLRGAHGSLAWTNVVTGDRVDWRWGDRNMTYTTELVNRVGPAGD